MKRIIKIFCFAAVPVVVIAGFMLFGSKSYFALSAAAALLCCIPFFMSFEKSSGSTRRVVLIAVAVAISVAGRFMFAPLQFFKPVTAVVVIFSIYFGCEFGFLTGALSALVSNFYFGQGPWTPFQMFSWGIIGLVAGLLADPLRRNRLILLFYGLFAGVAYSLMMDVFTAMWLDGEFRLSRFTAALATSLPVMAIYAVSNVIFLIVLTPLFGKKLERLQTKYGIMGSE